MLATSAIGLLALLLLGLGLAQSHASAAETQVANGDFESGSTDWVESSLLGYPLIMRSTDLPVGIVPHSGSWAAWLGGDNGELAYLEQMVTIGAQAPVLGYHHWIDSADTCGWDFARVRVNAVQVSTYSLCLQSSTGGWTRHTIDLARYAGQTVLLRFELSTDGSHASSLYLDDIALQGSTSPTPTPPPPSDLPFHVYLPLTLGDGA
jgi:aminopeptidase S